MDGTIEIPKIDSLDGPCPGWFAHDWQGKHARPIIKCLCGAICHIDLHHVHLDGTVTASFFHSAEGSFLENGKPYYHKPGCGWHVWLKLKDYDQGEFSPEP